MDKIKQYIMPKIIDYVIIFAMTFSSFYFTTKVRLNNVEKRINNTVQQDVFNEYLKGMSRYNDLLEQLNAANKEGLNTKVIAIQKEMDDMKADMRQIRDAMGFKVRGTGGLLPSEHMDPGAIGDDYTYSR